MIYQKIRNSMVTSKIYLILLLDSGTCIWNYLKIFSSLYFT